MDEYTCTSSLDDIGPASRQEMEDWYIQYKRAMDFDLWGQPVEAICCYNRLALSMRHSCNSHDSTLSDEQRKVINKIASCLEMRTKVLQVPGKLEDITLQDLKEVEYCVKHINEISTKDFPTRLQTRHMNLNNFFTPADPHQSLDTQLSLPADEEFVDKRLLGGLLPVPELPLNHTLLTIRIDRLGIKDPAQYIDCYITVSVTDGQGHEVLPAQDTPVTPHKQDSCVLFGMDVHLQSSLEQLPSDFAVFFEFKHFKPKKKMISTKCWAFMEKDEIKDGPVALELYKKPTNYKRKKLNLLTVKPLYLHVKLTLHTFGT